jgi:hypothetical protein
VLTADGAQANGMRWAAPPASGIQPTIIDAKGDLIVGTANDTPARQGVGADGTVLIADSSQAGGVRWGTPKPPPTVIQLRNAWSGNQYCMPYIYGLTAWEFWSWFFYAKQSGYLYCVVRVPPGCTSASAIELNLTGSAAGIARFIVNYAQIAPGGNLNFGAYTALTAQNLSIAAGWTLVQATYPLGITPTAGSLLVLQIFHDGTNAADTLSGGHALLLNAYLIA